MNEATKQEPGAVEALLLPFKDSHSLAFTLQAKARIIDQQIAALTRERDAAREALKAAERIFDEENGNEVWRHFADADYQLVVSALREQPTDTAEGEVDAGS
jgi:fatty acid/phospholipid biosynthesis enzyme